MKIKQTHSKLFKLGAGAALLAAVAACNDSEEMAQQSPAGSSVESRNGIIADGRESDIDMNPPANALAPEFGMTAQTTTMLREMIPQRYVDMDEDHTPLAVATMKPTSGNEASGLVAFIETDDQGIRVIADLSNIPMGMHGFHVHENGDCSAPDASSAGGHFNPAGQPHAGPDAERRHVGDLGNLQAGADQNASLDKFDDVLKLDGDHSIVGKAIVIHSGRDDMMSQPSGDAGQRIACGVVILHEVGDYLQSLSSL